MFTQLFDATLNVGRIGRASAFRAGAALLLGVLLALGGPIGVGAWDGALMERTMAQRYGAWGQQAFTAWRTLVEGGAQWDEREKLRRVNEHWNRAVRFGEDMEIWGQEDYWATPVETLGRGRGDCEDYVIGKYFTLRAMGVPEERLRLTYVRARVGSATQAHMVLSYYATPEAMPLVLDSLVSSILPASSRPDLTPVFSFNAEGIFAGPGNAASHPVDRLTRWRDVLARMRAEGSIP
ncbi:transglutaminase-like cysteine peptidase [Pseudacidovorax sp. RU35E]|uniref:transglutaminase-like cysteine peptidase n=1 Tax=Pseudacidovorax sp. RU35E TaxID=1907403 RepID=UPI000955F407|nr:Predicted transglutaminase-like cysteine proteinase [Pseudacidovorax sp. RU35E]